METRNKAVVESARVPADANRSIKLADIGQTLGIDSEAVESAAPNAKFTQSGRPRQWIENERTREDGRENLIKNDLGCIRTPFDKYPFSFDVNSLKSTIVCIAATFRFLRLSNFLFGLTHCTRASSSIVAETLFSHITAIVGNTRCLIVNEAISLFSFFLRRATSQLPLRDQLFLHLNRAVIYGKVLEFFFF